MCVAIGSESVVSQLQSSFLQRTSLEHECYFCTGHAPHVVAIDDDRACDHVTTRVCADR